MSLGPLLFLIVICAFGRPSGAAPGLIEIPGGTYTPFLLQSKNKSGQDQFKRTPVQVDSFSIDRDLVTNRDFLKFVKSNPQWRRSNVKRIFADGHYLEGWRSDLKPGGPEDGSRPVTRVSWFAARAYCESRNMDLPTTNQWEYVFFDQGRNQKAVKEKVLAWYGRPTPRTLAKTGSGGKNGYGVYDLSTLVWEWTRDFNSFLAGNELRDGESKDNGLYCGGGGLGTLDSSDYAAFMRYSFRTSLKANYTTGNLGFRCVKENESGKDGL